MTLTGLLRFHFAHLPAVEKYLGNNLASVQDLRKRIAFSRATS